MKLSDREWKEFKITEILSNSINSKAYHSSSLQEVLPGEKGIPYITRTNLNNGLFSIVKEQKFEINPKNTISFGAENATYFYQSFSYITGNKMYYYEKDLSPYIMLFITSCLNKSISGCGFGYGMGLTGSRSDSRKVMLPSKQGKPDYQFMEDYIKKIMLQKRKEYLEYANSKIEEKRREEKRREEKRREEIEPLHSKKWKEFNIAQLFDIYSGKRLESYNQQSGNIPFIGATDSNNGITNFISNTNSSLDKNVLGVNYNGSVVCNYYHPYKCIFSDDVKRFHLKNKKDRKDILLFFSTIIYQQREKYRYAYKFNAERMKRQYIMLPINKNNEPDYEYMEMYMKNNFINKYQQYIDYMLETIKTA